ncbi:acetyl-CoA carboxylase carboxyltransferase subunit alpha [Roseburia hominis]
MKLANMFKKTNRKNYISLTGEQETYAQKEEEGAEGVGAGNEMLPEVPEGLLRKCNACKAAILTDDVKKGYYICPKCHNYFRVHAMRRIEMVADAGTFEEWDTGLASGNPLHYKGYEEKLHSLREKTGLDEAVVTGQAEVSGNKVVLAVCDGRFMMASMGWVVGEKITRAVEKATEKRLPVLIFACSGGARMQEGIHSLMQMAKTAAALKRHHDAGCLYISVLTDPTTGGVTASFAMLGDVILAEPGALIGFAGPRVIEQTIGQKLPQGFQRAEFLLEHGFVDRIVEREKLKTVLSEILCMSAGTKGPKKGESRGVKCSQENDRQKAEETQDYAKLKGEQLVAGGKMESHVADRQKVKQGQKSLAANISVKKGKKIKAQTLTLSAWERVQKSRLKDRPVGKDYIEALFSDFIEFHGDRYFGDDKAIIGGIARFHGQPVTVIAQAKGKCTKENIERNFGMPSPEGYRKALRLMKQAEKFSRPVLCFVDTPGAFCGMEAEERGQGEAIARNLFEMSALKVPVLSVVIGEGGSGGALAMAVADEVWLLENSIYSILSPEGFASILWKDGSRAKEAAKVMKLTASHLKEAGIVERVLPEPEHFTVDTLGEVTGPMEEYIEGFLQKYLAMDEGELVQKRYERFRSM